MGVIVLKPKHSYKGYKNHRPERNTVKKRYIAEVFCTDCGTIFYPFLENVSRKLTTNCRACSTTKHGGSKTKLYGVWEGMKQRCFNPKDKNYHNYGGRGITVCESWSEDFGKFRDYMESLPKDGHTVDRINNDGNYEPGNVRWATVSMQNSNRRKKEKVDKKAYMKEYNKKNWKKYRRKKQKI